MIRLSHSLPDVTLQSTRHKVIGHGLQEVTSESQVISHDPSVTSMVLMVQNVRIICIAYIYCTCILTYVLVDIDMR